MPVELKNFDSATHPKLFIAEVPVENIQDYSRSGSDDSSLQQMSVVASRIYGRRGKLQFLLALYFLFIVLLIVVPFGWLSK